MGTDEYTPAGADNYEIKPDFPEYRLLDERGAAATDARVTHLHTSIYRKELRVESRHPTLLVLRLMNYPAWRVEVNGKRVAPESQDPTGRMVVPLPAGHSDVDVRFTRTPERWVGDAISLVAVLALAALLFPPQSEESPEKNRGQLAGETRTGCHLKRG
jgi:hypothetical protein